METEKHFEARRDLAQGNFLRLPMEERERTAFAECGCLFAYPTWWMLPDGKTERVDCVHLECRIARGEKTRHAWLVRFSARFRSELENGWLRFGKESAAARKRTARLYWAMRKTQRFDIMSAVYSAVA